MLLAQVTHPFAVLNVTVNSVVIFYDTFLPILLAVLINFNTF